MIRILVSIARLVDKIKGYWTAIRAILGAAKFLRSGGSLPYDKPQEEPNETKGG